MTCETSLELIQRLVTEGLETADRARLDEHVGTCDRCAAALDEYVALWHDLGAALAPAPGDRARLRLADAIAAAREATPEPVMAARTEATAGAVSEGDVRGPAQEEDTAAAGSAVRRRPEWTRLAASILIFAAGAAAGLAWPEGEPEGSPGPSDTSTYLVLMRGDSDQPTESALDEWLGGLQEDGRVVGGAQLAETDGAWYGPPPEPFAVEGLFELFGYMIIEAEDVETARSIAQSSPHISGTGAVEIWPIR